MPLQNGPRTGSLCTTSSWRQASPSWLWRGAYIVALLSLSAHTAAAQHASQPQLFSEPRLQKPNPYALLDNLGEALSLVEAEYFEPVDPAELFEGALRGVAAGLDPHSAYFSAADLEIFEGDTSGRFGGIGVEVDFREGEIVIISPVEGSPAARADLGPGDLILAIDGISVEEKKPDELVRSMRGPVGSLVRVLVRKKQSAQVVELSLVREQIRVSSVKAQRLRGDIAYVRIKSFQDGTHTELLAAFARLNEEAPLAGVLLDVRNNPGGLVKEAVGVADEFLTQGVIYSTRHRGKTLRSAVAHGGGVFTRGPLVVLINEYSASAAELLAGALRDHRRALLVGAQTFGKGSVQTVLPLAHGAALKLTTALYYTPSGQTLQALGVSPSVPVDAASGEYSSLKVVRERDLQGHIERDGASTGTALDAAAIPLTDDELHLGVARVIPTDPSRSGDQALRVGYEIVTGARPQR